jgi:hypothetical protein
LVSRHSKRQCAESHTAQPGVKATSRIDMSHKPKTIFISVCFFPNALLLTTFRCLTSPRTSTMSHPTHHIHLHSFPSFTKQKPATMPSRAYPISKDIELTSMSPNPLDPQPTGVGIPADHLDPNHPHFPHDDLEAQPSSRPYYRYAPCMSKNTVIILSGMFLVLGSFALAILTGVKIGVGQVRTPSNTTIPVETVYHTTTVNATALVPVLVVPTTTVTMLTTILPTPSSGCTSKGQYVNKQKCEKQCNSFADERNTSAECEVAGGEKWTCKVCTGLSFTSQSPSATPTPTSSPTPTPPSAPLRPTIMPKTPTENCIVMGKFKDDAECNAVCSQMDAKTEKEAKCDKTDIWSCIVCQAGTNPSDRHAIEGPPSKG